MNEHTAADLIARLGLERHPEGGWYRETYRAAASTTLANGRRSLATAIYFLLQRGEISALHRIAGDELWHFYAGSSLTVHVIDPAGAYRPLPLGSDAAAGDAFQLLVPAGCWFGAEVSGEGDYSLVGCTVSPGFDFADFELGRCGELCTRYPAHASLIRRLTVDGPDR